MFIQNFYMKEVKTMKVEKFSRNQSLTLILLVIIVVFATIMVTLVIANVLWGPFSSTTIDYSQQYADQANATTEYVDQYSSALGDDIYLHTETASKYYCEYVVFSDSVGVIATGNAYNSRSVAFQHPLIIKIDEAKINLSIPQAREAGASIDRTESLQAGKGYLCQCHYTTRYPNGYMYVIVQSPEEISK